MKEYGIIGYPLTYTISPLFHQNLFTYTGYNAQYSAFPIEKEAIPRYIDKLYSGVMHGLSVTSPYKYEVSQYCDVLSPEAQYSGVVNTLTMQNGLLYGDNYDIAGIVKTLSLLPIPSTTEIRALLIGTGATAVSSIIALQKQGITSIYCMGRNKERLTQLQYIYNIHPLYYSFEEEDSEYQEKEYECVQHAPYTVVINTIQRGEKRVIPYKLLFALITQASFVFDVHYYPYHSLLLHDAREHTSSYVNGITMFIVQASLQFMRWTGIFPCYDALHKIREECIDDIHRRALMK